MILKAISPIFVNPLHESLEIEHSFRTDERLPNPNCVFMIFTCISDFSSDKVIFLNNF